MTQYRQILRLHSQGISQRSIAQSCRCSRNTVAVVLQRASAANLTWPLDVETDAVTQGTVLCVIALTQRTVPCARASSW